MVEIGWAGWTSLAVAVVTATIILSGIMIGIGRAFNNKRLEAFGIDELIQSIVNGAIVGGITVINGAIALLGSSFMVERKCGEGEVAILWLSCTLKQLIESTFFLFQHITRAVITIGYYENLTLNFDAFSIQPLANAAAIGSLLSSQASTLQLLLLMLNLNLQIVTFVAESSLVILLPAGIILRAIFATRRLGGFLIALSIGLFILYPVGVLIFPSPVEDVEAATAQLAAFNTNPAYATWPVLDLNNNYVIAEKLDNMSGWSNITPGGSINITNESTDFSGDLTYITKMNAQALGGVLSYAVIAPLFSLLLTAVFIKELTNILGGEIGIPFGVI